MDCAIEAKFALCDCLGVGRDFFGLQLMLMYNATALEITAMEQLCCQ